MSNYNWARGKVKLPAKFYPKVRDAILAAWNKQQQDRLALAEKVYAEIKKIKVPRGTDKRSLIEDACDREDTLGKGSPLCRLMARADDETCEQIADSIFPVTYKENKRIVATRPLKPKKKDFPLVNSRTKRLDGSYGDFWCIFDGATKTIRFGCAENNRAQERFMDHPIFAAIDRALSNVEWTSRTGGTLVGNDEYSRDSYEEGEGGNYKLREWSKKATANKRSFRRSYVTNSRVSRFF